MPKCWSKRKFSEFFSTTQLRNESKHATADTQLNMPSATRSGPKRFMFGFKDRAGNFHRSRTVSRHSQKIVAFTEWIPFETKQKVLVEWRLLSNNESQSIDGRNKHRVSNRWRWTIEAGWHTTYFNIHPHPLPMVPGQWELIIWEYTGKGHVLGRESVQVL